MFLALWYYLSGYDMIEVSGFSVERFVNMAAFRGVYIWDVTPVGASVQMKASKDGRAVLMQCAQKTGCNMQVIGRCGLPGFLSRYKKRKILAAGTLFFVLGLYALSSFIWQVGVIGNERIKTEELLLACEQLGLKPGAIRHNVDPENITNKLAEQFVDISWVSVHITGTNAQIRLVETIPQPQMIDRQTPCDIVASKDGVIKSIAAQAGTPMVSPGDVVEKGDVLISGEVIIKAGDEQLGTKYLRARGEVYGKLWHTYSEELPLAYTKKEFSGNVLTDYSFIINDTVINAIKPNTSEGLYETATEYVNELAIGDFPLGVALKKEIYTQYNEIAMTRSVDEAKTELTNILTQKAKTIEEDDNRILDVEITFEEFSDKVIATAIVAASERLDEEKNIQNGEVLN